VAEPAFAARSTIRKSIRVDADKVDDLMNQVGELVVNRSSFAQLFNDMRELTQYLNHRFSMDKTELRMVSDLTNRLSDATTVLGRVSSELQEQVMKVRMLPISRLFNRYPRLVHDLLRDSDKKIQLQFHGEETELDRMVIEQLADPMIHIIRNAVDHGIESCEDRLRKGKTEKGSLLLEAYHEGSNVIIEVTDDGQGLDLSGIRRKAVEKQLADRDTLDAMDQRSLINMIMLPGFSTADEITHTSGRGVGMDVVKRNIEKINGVLDIDTRQDVGTRIRIKIPLTLAIIPAMMIRCGGSHFTVPMSAVQETLRIDRGEIFTVDGSEVMHLHEEPLPLVRLSELLNMVASPAGVAQDRLFVVVVRSASGQTGFIVDALLGRQEVVIKPLEDYLQEDSGFSGATILGDGSISLILNVDELAVLAKEREAERKLAAAVL
jgi:two-component system chemotaxis sensor kinase CheA